MIFTTLYSPKGLWSEDITVWGTLSHVSLNVRSLIGVFAIFIFLVLRRFGVDYDVDFDVDFRFEIIPLHQYGVDFQKQSTPNRRQIDVKPKK